jgi:hypothetical protein
MQDRSSGGMSRHRTACLGTGICRRRRCRQCPVRRLRPPTSRLALPIGIFIWLESIKYPQCKGANFNRCRELPHRLYIYEPKGKCLARYGLLHEGALLNSGRRDGVKASVLVSWTPQSRVEVARKRKDPPIETGRRSPHHQEGFPGIT